MYELRPYQRSAVDSLNSYLCNENGNPCVVLPTGSGKSVAIAYAIRMWKEGYQNFRCCVLAHRHELVVQNSEKLQQIAPDMNVGVFSASARRRDYYSPVLFASIDSIYKRAGEFAPFDVLMVDEAHRIPFRGEGKYRTFIDGCKRFNEKLRVIGWTATPFRMSGGEICHKDHVLNHICYSASITDLIGKGYLCPLRSKVAMAQPDLSDVRRNSGGDYITSSLASATNKTSLVNDAIAEAMRIIISEQRKTIVFFCVDIEHCKAVSDELRKYGVAAPCVTRKTRKSERDRIVRDFKSGRIHAICNVNVFTEGFDVPHIDCIVLLRPTLSPGLFSQMVGRGLRIHASKQDCLILDFAGCIERHGPLDLLGGGYVAMAVCGNCRESFSRAIRRCPQCGWEIPKQEVARLDSVESERRMHGIRASNKSILSSDPETHVVDAVYVARHCKPGSPDSLRVQYRCGMAMYSEWVCLEHDGYAGRKARQWWRERFGNEKLATINEALGDLFLCQELLKWTRTVTVKRNGRHWEVIGYNQEA